MKNVCRE